MPGGNSWIQAAQSNSVATTGARGVDGSLIWIWESEDVIAQVESGNQGKPNRAKPISCDGSCPGVGIIELTNSGASGKLVTALRTTNTVDNAPPSAPGGVKHKGDERSDPRCFGTYQS